MERAKRGRKACPSPPNKRRKGKAASETVSESPVDEETKITTDLIAPSPDTEGGRERTVVHDSSEDFNERSQTRTKLLTQINAILNRDVSPTLWACCQLADISCLEKLIRIEPQTLDLVIRTIGRGLDSVPGLCKLLID
jgi:hypothetical protein